MIKRLFWDTVVHQYQFWPRLAGAAALIGLFVIFVAAFSEDPGLDPKTACSPICRPSSCLNAPNFLGYSVDFGGAFNSDSGVPWESAARTRYTLLNEAILDDGQALYRAYSTHRRATERALRSISPEELRQAIQVLSGNPQAATLDEAFTRKTRGDAFGSPASSCRRHFQGKIMRYGLCCRNIAIWD